MLESLHITNYALIDETDIKFHRGLNIITGETGAGKSIILGALSMLLGARADTKKANSEGKTVVEAEFDTRDYPEVNKLIESTDIDSDGSTSCILRREITASGRTRSFVNDTPVTLTRLQEIAEKLTDIHSQHENQLLSKPEFQLDVIDTLADNEALLEEFSKKFTTFREALIKLKKTKLRIERNRNDEDFLRYQQGHFEKVGPRPGELDELEAEAEKLSAGAELKGSLHDSLESLSLGERNALDLIEVGLEKFEEVADSVEADSDIIARMENLIVELKDIVEIISSLYNDVQSDPDELETVESRISAIKGLMKRHNAGSLDELIKDGESIKRRLESIETADETLAALEKDARRKYAAAKETASVLSSRRKEAAKLFETMLMERAIPLGMKNLRCEVNVETVDMTATGTDKVEFAFAFNKNQAPAPVGGHASGGEISRLMLCIKSLVADKMSLPTIIFDEIDTGVSGEVASKIGEMMKEISKSIQVIAITHLPQVAAMGDNHFKVFKTDDEHSTHTRITELDPEGRVEELATMLGGGTDAEAARANARSLLNKK